jgi:hypothetical protein
MIKYLVMWGEDIYDSFSKLEQAEYVRDKYSYKYPDTNFRIIKQTCTEEEVGL